MHISGSLTYNTFALYPILNIQLLYVGGQGKISAAAKGHIYTWWWGETSSVWPDWLCWWCCKWCSWCRVFPTKKIRPRKLETHRQIQIIYVSMKYWVLRSILKILRCHCVFYSYLIVVVTIAHLGAILFYSLSDYNISYFSFSKNFRLWNLRLVKIYLCSAVL